MGEADQPRKGEGGTAAGAGGAKRRRRRRRPKRASAEATGRGDVQKSGQRSQKTAGGTSSTITSEAGSSDRRPATAAPRSKKKKSASQKTRKKSTKTRRKGPAVPTKREISAGGVVYQRDGDEIEVVLASRRTRRGQLAWGLAKGGIEDEETMEDAAIREVREETGLLVEIEASLGETRYFYVWENVRIRKTVHFFLMRHTGGDVDDRDDEMEEIRWFPLERALKRAAYRGERDVLERAAELLR
ncbi:MAG TPA: NUDIX hydrolase [Actinomycetota bacterium]|nr:NUDIX hydrolase [Actinomycetota bacterium]